MKKLGFTLAEVLITLGIIGVVAALTAPALVQNAGTAKVGPTLAKVVSTLEVANEQMLHDEDATDLSKVCQGEDVEREYTERLAKYVAGSSYDKSVLKNAAYSATEDDGDENEYEHFVFGNVEIFFSSLGGEYNYDPKGSFKGRFLDFQVDINGQAAKPNRWGKDLFWFYIDKTGTIIPEGGRLRAWLHNEDEPAWEKNCNEDTVTDGDACAGSIFDNNMKVIYQ